MPDVVALLAEALRRAASSEPQVTADVERLLRRWESAGSPPKKWTIRWNAEACGLLEEVLGLELCRVASGGGRVVSLEALCATVDGADSLRAALQPMRRKERDFSPLWDSLILKMTEGAGKRWLMRVRRNDREPADDLLFVARALDVASNLQSTMHMSDLGARVGATSKFFRPGERGTKLLADALESLDESADSQDASRDLILERHGLLFSPTAYSVLVCGRLSIGEPPLDFPSRLAERDQAALLTLENVQNARLLERTHGIITIENEATFLAAIREGLHRTDVIVMTAGFPNRAVVSLLKSIVNAGVAWRHWGDADLAGIRIARHLSSILGHAPTLFRCSGDEVRRLRKTLIPLTQNQRDALVNDLQQQPNALGHEVIRAILQEGGWLEQEAWVPALV